MATIGTPVSIGGVMTAFPFTAVADAETWTGPASGVYWFSQTNHVGTATDAGVSVERSGTTYTFHPGEDAATGWLFIEKREG